MNTQSNRVKNAEAVEEFSKWAVGLGIVGVALFPLSIPILVLTAVALAPFALLAVPLIVVALPAMLLRRALRGRRRGRPSPPASEAGPTKGPASQLETANVGRVA